MIEEESVLKAPGPPLMTNEIVKRAVSGVHSYGKLTIAHTLTYVATEEAIAAGMDSLAHIFIDRLRDSQLVSAIATSGAFVTPCLVLNASIMGQTGTSFAADKRGAAN